MKVRTTCGSRALAVNGVAANAATSIGPLTLRSRIRAHFAAPDSNGIRLTRMSHVRSRRAHSEQLHQVCRWRSPRAWRVGACVIQPSRAPGIPLVDRPALPHNSSVVRFEGSVPAPPALDASRNWWTYISNVHFGDAQFLTYPHGPAPATPRDSAPKVRRRPISHLSSTGASCSWSATMMTTSAFFAARRCLQDRDLAAALLGAGRFPRRALLA